jgi:hypothetical protein
MYMMVPTGWANGPPGSWKGSGLPQMGMAADPHMMASWHNATMPQQWASVGVMSDKGMPRPKSG